MASARRFYTARHKPMQIRDLRLRSSIDETAVRESSDLCQPFADRRRRNAECARRQQAFLSDDFAEKLKPAK